MKYRYERRVLIKGFSKNLFSHGTKGEVMALRERLWQKGRGYGGKVKGLISVIVN